jgi:hypothetical protein
MAVTEEIGRKPTSIQRLKIEIRVNLTLPTHAQKRAIEFLKSGKISPKSLKRIGERRHHDDCLRKNDKRKPG